MNIRLDGKKWAEMLKGLLPREVVVFLCIASMGQGYQVQFKMEELAASTGMCRITLRRSLRALERENLVTLIEQSAGPTAKTTLALNRSWVTLEDK
jgi:CRP-like cAMP-binding protein